MNALPGGSEPLDWASFSGNRPLFDQLIDINSFGIVCSTAPTPEINDVAWSQKLSSAIYQHMLTAIETAGFYAQDRLKIASRAGRASVTYADDRYDFTLDVDSDSIVIRRDGSKLSDFHVWFTSIGQALSPLIAGVLEQLEKQTDRKYSIFSSSFQFKFITYDHFAEQNNRPIRNSELIRKLVVGIPDDSGDLSNEDEAFKSALRLDVSFSRWVTNNDGISRNERYAIEAPANKQGAGLWFAFSYGGETLDHPDSDRRESFHHKGFFDEYELAYATFLRDKALLTFMKQLLTGIKFKSAPGNLP